ncbi:MAG: hypothetical protein WKF61_05755 [Luteimonas sp.]
MARTALELYEQVASARVPDALLVEALDLVGHSPRMLSNRADLVDRLCDEEHALVLRKEVTDVVMLVTGALEAPTVEVFRAFVDYAEAQVPLLEPFDDLTRLLRCELGAKLAADALEDVVDDRERVGANLQEALALLGEARRVEDLVEIWKAEA